MRRARSRSQRHRARSGRGQIVVGLMVFSLAVACSSGSDDDPPKAGDQQRVDEAERAGLAVVDGVVREVADELQMTLRGGNHFFALCGERYAAQGVIHQVILDLSAPAEATTDGALERWVEALEADGWTIESRSQRRFSATSTSGDLSAEFGGSVSVDLRSGCVETDDATAIAAADRPEVEITWP